VEIVLILLAAANGLYFTVLDETWLLGPAMKLP